MKIALLCRDFYQYDGGVALYTSQIANAFAKRGHEVHIIAEIGKANFGSSDLESSVYVHGVHFDAEPFRGAWRLNRKFALSDIRYANAANKKLHQVIQKHGIDIVESPDLLAQGLFYSISKRRTVPLVIRLHGGECMFTKIRNLLKDTNLGLKQRILSYFESTTVKNADARSAVSYDFADAARRIWRLNGEDIETIHNGIDIGKYAPGNTLRQSDSVLFVGRIEERKGASILTEAINIVRSEYPKIRFLFAGRSTKRGNKGDTWKDYIARNVPRNNLLFLGQIDANQLVSYYQRSRICVFPSLYEPSGLVLLEAMACGCAVIATDVGGFAEVIRNEEDGILVPPNDPAALALAVKRLLKDDVLRTKVSKNAINRIRNEFSADIAAEKTLKFYEQVISDCNRHKKADCRQ